MGKNMDLIIVESPTKAKTIGKFLSKNYQVLATMGHIRDLPKKKFGVEISENGKVVFEPEYEIMADKKKVVSELKNKIKKAKNVILATDLDREGEAIAFHILVASLGKDYKKDKRVKRIVFHEITKKAIDEAIASPRNLDIDLVNAQQGRRILDRIVGYKLSPLLWRKVRRGLSAGRVQSVAVRLIVEREREIEKFPKGNYFRVWAIFETDKKESFVAELVKVDGKSIEKKEVHKLFAGTHRSSKTIFEKELQAEKIITNLSFSAKVSDVSERESLRRPLPPYTTSTLQQDASRRFGWSSKLTMRVAQSLYEKGLITYHRTDSTFLGGQFVSAVRKQIKDKFGGNYLPEKPTFYKTKSKLAQEAHEAIRPTNSSKEDLTGKTDARQEKLYRLILQRAVASQMVPAKLAVTNLKVEDGNCLFATQGTRLIFDGFTKVYPIRFSEVELPKLVKGQNLKNEGFNLSAHEVTPPPRYNEASLISILEKEGIGRPSTYAPIISVIQIRSYVEKEEGKFKPTNLGIAVNDFLVANFADIVNLPFTAKMEEDLDSVSTGKKNWMETLGKFWKPFIKEAEKVKDKAERVKIEVEKLGEKCPECKKGELVIRVGRFGKFIACDNFPECKYTRPFIKEVGFNCPDCGSPVVARKTKKGRQFYGCSGWPNCKWASWKKPKDLPKKTDSKAKKAKK
jgi:DNA topoisomerase I